MITEGLDQAAIPAWAARWSGMRATGVGVKLARRCNSSHRICQFRPHAKLSTSAAKIAKTITNVTVIEYPSGEAASLPRKRLPNPFSWTGLTIVVVCR